MTVPAEPARCAWTLSVVYAKGTRLPAHRHAAHQLIYATAGVMTIHVRDDVWVVPPQRGLVVPAHTPHAITMETKVALTTLYIRADWLKVEQCCVISVSALLRELILHAAAAGTLDDGIAAHQRVLAVLLDQLAIIPSAPLQVVLPADPRARRVAEWLRSDPGDSRSIDTLARAAGASRRTSERLFATQTGMTVSRWRQQARVLAALPRLARGEPVAAVTLDVGYSSSSAFIHTFKRILGVTPGEYYRVGDRPHPG